jgi:glycosyltransferase involved in cell wall biosynthesis
MRVLISAVACHPYWGSECYFGWAAVNALASRHELTVLTHSASIADIERAAAQNNVLRRVRFIGVGEAISWHPNRLLARIQSWNEYSSWCREAHKTALSLLRSESYDLGQHITYSTWRRIPPLANLRIPWILGPIGGGETLPHRFRGILSLQSRLFEFARDVSSKLARQSPALRHAIQSAAFVLTSTPETKELVHSMGAAPTRVVLAPAAFIHGDRIKLFKSLHRSKATDCLRIFAGGNLEGRKGLALALQTLASLQKRGIPFEFTFAGYGPELSHIRKLAKQIALDPSRVRFRDSLPLDEYRQTLQQTDVYLLPSLRESGGLTLGEAMLAGCVPVVIRAGGPGLLVTPECGYAFEPDSPEHVVEQMTDALQRLWHDADHRERLSSNAVTRAETVLSEERYLKAVEGAYYATVKA